MRLALALALCLLTGSAEARNDALWAAFHSGGIGKGFVQAVAANGGGSSISSFSATGSPFGHNQSAVGQLSYVTSSGATCADSSHTDVTQISDGTNTWLVTSASFFDFAADGTSFDCVISFFLTGLTPGATTLTVSLSASVGTFPLLGFHVVAGVSTLDAHSQTNGNAASTPFSAGSITINTGDYVYTSILATDVNQVSTIVRPPAWITKNAISTLFYDAYTQNSPGGSVNPMWNVVTGAGNDFSATAIAVR